MLLYYAVHSTINQIRKFVRTWAFVLLLGIVAMGGVVWYAALWYYARLREVDAALPENMAELFEASGLTSTNVAELVLGLSILGILVLQVIGAEKSVARLFMQADVNMLFPSPRSPQSILAFRVTSTLSLAIVAVPCMLLWVPSWMSTYGIGLYAALTFPLAWALTLGFSALFKILAFELGSRHPFLRNNLRWFVIGALALVGLVFYRAYDTSPDRDLLASAQLMFNAPWTRAVPVWGWIKGLVVFALEGHTGESLGMLGLCLALLGVLVVAAWRTKADYYEETLGWAEEVARFRERLTSTNAPLLVLEITRRGQDKGLEGFERGWGASVYFFKVLHQRRRFSRYGFVTKTMVTYLFAAIAAGLFTKHFMDEALPYIPALVLAAMVFFRTVISPVTEDIRKDGFLMLPESIWAKLIYSLAGGACNCALDVAVPLVAGSVAAGFSPLEGLAYLPVLASADFFASASGAFVDISIPPAIGVGLKQVAQVLLLYFGLIFDGMVVTYGIGSDHTLVGFALVFVLNLLFGLTFLGLTGVWLHPRGGRPARQEALAADDAAARRAYARVGLALTGMFVAIHGGQYLLSLWAPPVVAVYVPVYAMGLPVFLALAGFGPRAALTGQDAAPDAAVALRRLGVRRLLSILPACLFVAYAGNVLGYGLQWALDTVFPFTLLPQVVEPSTELMGLQMALLSLASPAMEELVFRRYIIDRLRPFGERAALVTSALSFGLFHGSANQFCYGMLLGLVFGYVYLRTGRLRYSLALHVVINAMSSVVLPALLVAAAGATLGDGANGANTPLTSVITDPGVMALMAYLALLFVLTLLGSVIFAYGVSERRIQPGSVSLRVALTSWGMVAFVVISLAALL